MTQETTKRHYKPRTPEREKRDEVVWGRITSSELTTLDEMWDVLNRDSRADLIGAILREAIRKYKDTKVKGVNH